MIKFSTRSHYGLRVMVDLARNYGKSPLPLTDIARGEALSLGYLEHLMTQLRTAGLVEGTKGVRGGYRLIADPTLITVGSVLRALEGPVAPITCASEETVQTLCERENECHRLPSGFPSNPGKNHHWIQACRISHRRAAAAGAIWLGVSKVVVALFIGGFAMSMGMWFSKIIKKNFHWFLVRNKQ